MGDVTPIDPSADAPTVLEEAKTVFNECMILGYDDSGTLMVMGTSDLTTAEVIFMMEQYKQTLLMDDDC